MSSSKRVESPFARSLLAGAVAGTTVDLSLFPLDTLKTRLQSSEGFIASGGFRGIYRGIGSAVVGSAPGAALFFVTYDSVKRALSNSRNRSLQLQQQQQYTADGTKITPPAAPGSGGWAEPLSHMGAASLGEVAACAVRVPTEVVKQRAQASQHPSSAAALQHILRQRHAHGLAHVWRELYRGWGITIMREVPFTVIQFPLWEGMKEWSRRTNGKDSVSAFEGAAFGSVAGAVAAGVTTPLDVLKTRLMLSTQRQKVVPLLTSILRESGPMTFFSGIGPRVFWISTGGAIFLGSYQWAINALGGAD
ncbi:mitochondrial carrier [Diplodia corticola]|uniref:Mitochondrial carrier n=1 Tax=Diplodia corticola TaxID=236234 RepID=A0A1J9RE03_9PEZI|nr:mitochondrial carrier [Diplodia corticola]OJD38768.1 mitochondrial carrier [Diplodia corticola]